MTAAKGCGGLGAEEGGEGREEGRSREEGAAKCRAVAAVTAVPRLWPKRMVFPGGCLSVVVM